MITPSPYDRLHRVDVEWQSEIDPETDSLIRDLVEVETSAHQTMVIVGPWFEARVAHLIRQWLPSGWTTSGPSQVFDHKRPGLRSRSWDIIVHKVGLLGLPPEAYPGAGFTLLPKQAVAVVIDTKTHYSTPRAYAAKPVFNLMNDAVETQFDFLGREIRKMLLIARSDRPAAALAIEGKALGLDTFCLAQMKSSPVSDGPNRVAKCLLNTKLGETPRLGAFRAEILEAIKDCP